MLQTAKGSSGLPDRPGPLPFDLPILFRDPALQKGPIPFECPDAVCPERMLGEENVKSTPRYLGLSHPKNGNGLLLVSLYGCQLKTTHIPSRSLPRPETGVSYDPNPKGVKWVLGRQSEDKALDLQNDRAIETRNYPLDVDDPPQP